MIFLSLFILFHKFTFLPLPPSSVMDFDEDLVYINSLNTPVEEISSSDEDSTDEDEVDNMDFVESDDDVRLPAVPTSICYPIHVSNDVILVLAAAILIVTIEKGVSLTGLNSLLGLMKVSRTLRLLIEPQWF